MDTDPDGLPHEHLTADQLVAINMRRWRIAARMTQEGLGKRLGWTPANVSSAERSADPARDPRRFNAETLTSIAVALGVPLLALFLPPHDDGARARYAIMTASGRELDMGDLLDEVVMHDNGDRSPPRVAYLEALLSAADRYLDPEWAQQVSQWLAGDSPWERAERAARFRERAEELLAARDTLDRTAADFKALADRIEAPE